MLCFNYGITMNLSQTGCNDEVLVAKNYNNNNNNNNNNSNPHFFLFFFKQCAITWLQKSLTDGASCCPA